MSDWINLFSGAYKEMLLILLTVLGYIAITLLVRQAETFRNFVTSRRRALNAVCRSRDSDGVREGEGLWIKVPTSPPENYVENFGTKVVTFANNKGGVGKTTLAANLAAYWATDWRKNVLLVDLDYQGTLSAMALRRVEDWLPRNQDSLATRAISGDYDPNDFISFAKDVPNAPRLKIVPAYYDLAQAENRLIIEWLLQAPRERQSVRHFLSDLLLGKSLRLRDVRYNLARLLQSNAVRNRFDVVILDCPPRLTTSTIQALCASSHIVVPTILDVPSAEAVVSFCKEIETLKRRGVCPNLINAGIVGMRVSHNVGEIAEIGSKKLIQDSLADLNLNVEFVREENFVRDRAPIVTNASEGIAYLAMGANANQQEIRASFSNLAQEIALRIGLPPPSSIPIAQTNVGRRVA